LLLRIRGRWEIYITRSSAISVGGMGIREATKKLLSKKTEGKRLGDRDIENRIILK
jgi:hypothetical protein